MPFEPLKPPADAERFASPQLEALADQLRHDAQWLSAKYPAHKPRFPLARPRRLRWVAVASVAVLMLLAVDAWRMWTTPARPSLDDTVQTQLPAEKSVDAASGTGIIPSHPAMTNARPAAVPPNLGYNDLTGAEKEALLDLLEQRPPVRLRVSL